MSGPDRGGATFRAVLALPHARRLFTAAMLARSCYGLLPLPLLLALQQATRSYTLAGATAAASGLATALLGPYRARLVERHPRALTVFALCYAALLTAVAVGCAAGGPVPLTLGLAVLAGTCPPPVGPLMRTLWGRLARGEAQQQAALSLDTAAESTVFALGPVLGALLAAAVTPPVVLLLSALLVVIGFGLLARALRGAPERVRVSGAAGGGGASTPLRRPGFLPLLLVVLATASGLSLFELGVLAAWGTVATGVLGTLFSVGGVLGGLLYGRRRWPGPLTRRPVVLAAGAAAAYGLPVLLHSAPTAGVALLLAGAFTDVLLITSYQLVDRLVPEGSRTEAGAWVNTAFNLGAAAGSALGGTLVDRSGPSVVFAVTAAVIGACALLCAPALTRRPADRTVPDHEEERVAA
ncbi:MFS transporter [Kitasatospora sp. NPDC051853]|uniref:MFS transporter n=1 Tax=Kitasatospora sp. NPDC051853 TaxID=3364058 RepID=UPI0037B2F392